MCYVTEEEKMSIGDSGRIVIEIQPDMKRELHAALSRDGLTLKTWFVEQVGAYLQNCNQMPMFGDEKNLNLKSRNEQ
jgi:hypothetical protein